MRADVRCQPDPTPSAVLGASRDQCRIGAHHQPAALLDLLTSRGVEPHRVLRGTRLFPEDFSDGRTRISAAELLALIAHAERALDAPDTAFLWGERLLPGHYGAASLALQQASDLQHALDLVVEFRSVLSPLAAPRLEYSTHHVTLTWLDTAGCGAQWPFVFDATLRALASATRWLGGTRLPWRYEFNRPAPAHDEHVRAHLGDDVHFAAPQDLMRLPRDCLHLPWAGAASARVAQALRAEALAIQAAAGPTLSLIESVYAVLHREAAAPPGLDALAAHFGVSAATLKRRLQAHGTHYQALVDLARKQVALQRYRAGDDHAGVAAHLRIPDSANFRRAFKRWTGTTPRALFGWVGGD